MTKKQESKLGEAAAHLAHLKKLDLENEEFEKRMGYGKYDSPEERWRKLNPPIKRPDKK